MGVITQYLLLYNEAEGSVVLQQLWQKESFGLAKVNALVADDKRIIVGGFSADGRGLLEIWKQEVRVPTPEGGKASIVDDIAAIKIS